MLHLIDMEDTHRAEGYLMGCGRVGWILDEERGAFAAMTREGTAVLAVIVSADDWTLDPCEIRGFANGAAQRLMPARAADGIEVDLIEMDGGRIFHAQRI